MLITARYLVDRLRQPRSRADEVLTLRRRLADDSDDAPEAEVLLAQRMRALREQLSALIGAVQACRSCAIGHPPPHGHFAGGHCCGLKTEDAFNDDEVAALRLAGTTPAHLRAPRGDHAGCSFRGPKGCSLRVPDRPNLCLRYLCPDLQRELSARGDLGAINAANAELEAAYLLFIQKRAARQDDALLGITP